MNRCPIKGCWWVVTKDGGMRMHNANGEEVFGEAYCRVVDKVDEVPYAIVKVIVNIAGSEEEMLQKIKEMNESGNTL